MTAVGDESQVPPEGGEQPVKKRRGPRKESEVRAEAERELREKIEAEVRAEYEQKLREQQSVESASEAKPISAADVSGDPNAEGAVVMHFVDDGFTALGKVWYRGEELTLVPGSSQWEDAPRPGGKLFALLDEDEQIALYGRRLFRQGPWRGQGFDLNDPELTEDEREVLRRAEEKRLQRTGVPARN